MEKKLRILDQPVIEISEEAYISLDDNLQIAESDLLSEITND